MSKKIAIIGAGQLGSRHLQGIAQSSFDISIEVVEPFEVSRKIAQDRFYQIKNREKVTDISFYDSIEKLSNKLDLVIIATNTDVRFNVVKELLDRKDVLNLVLEKVLFQSIDEYYMIEKLLEENSVECWVNHSRRMFPFYKQLKEELKDANQISYNFQGGDWGLGCNGLHFIDHLSYLSDATNLTINNSLLNDKIYNSKRKGFIEFNGLLTGKLDNHLFSLYSNSKKSSGILSIVSDMLTATIDEVKGKITISKLNNQWNEEVIETKIVYFQSELSNILIEDILIENSCNLPTYKEAMNLHIPFIKSLLNHMQKVTGQEHKICPIT